MRERIVRLASAGVVCALLLAACAKTMVNSGPSAVAPAISWIVQVVDTNDTKNVAGSGTVTVPRGDLRIYIHAKSPSGVKTVTDGKFIDATFTCISGNIGQTSFKTLAGGTQSQTPDAQNEVIEDLVLFQVFGTGFTCKPGFHYSGGSMTITAKATNFANKSTTATLKLNLQ